MIKKTVIRWIKQIFNIFGLNLSRTATSHKDPFTLQRELITRRDPVIFDIGANIGGIAKIYRGIFPLASIHCFEPFPETFQKLSKNVEEDPLIFCHEIAVSEIKGSAVLNINLRPETNSLLVTGEKGATIFGEGKLDTISQVVVGTTTIDTFCLEADIPYIDILKMDVQGAEYSVLLGARNMLKNQRISLIYTELIMRPTYQGQRKFHEYLTLLDSYGYEFLDFYNQSWNHNQLIQADLIFLSSSFQEDIQQ